VAGGCCLRAPHRGAGARAGNWSLVEGPGVRVLTELSKKDSAKFLESIRRHRYAMSLVFTGWRFSGETPPLVIALKQRTWSEYVSAGGVVGETVRDAGGTSDHH